MLRYALVVCLLASVGAVGAHAACVPQTDDTGCFTTDPTHSLCEQRAGRNAAVMGQAMLTCHRKMARSALTGQPFDEEACEAAAVQKFLAKTDVTNCPCITTSSVATLWETQLDALNGYVYCNAAGVAFGGDDGGRAPVTRAESRCEDNLAKCVAKLVKDSEKCHRSAAKATVKSTAFDEEACEEGPLPGKPGKAAIERYDACVARVLAQGGCTGCESPAAAAAFVDSIIDDRNDLIFCMDQPNVCPSRYEFTARPGSDQDVGWTGTAHDQTLTDNIRLTLAITGCANPSPPCGACAVTGPIRNVGGPTFASQRCRGDDAGAAGSWIACTADADCPGTGNACAFFFGPPQPVSAVLPFCLTNEVVGGVSGTVDPDSGAAALPMSLRASRFVGPTFESPCPHCIAGACDDGPRAGQPCTAQATSALYSGPVSLDCPPRPLSRIDTATLPLVFSTGSQTATLDAASPPCTATGYGGFQCLCDTCDNAAVTPCRSNADCVAVGASTCGGKRCFGSGNAGTPCATNSECPGGGVCGRPGIPTQPNQCNDGVCTPNTPPDDDSTNEGACLAGPFEQFCDLERFRGCATNADCPLAGDACTFGRFRECFTDNGTVGGSVSVAGAASPLTPTLGTLFCAAPTPSGFVNTIYGLPGLERITIPGVTVIH